MKENKTFTYAMAVSVMVIGLNISGYFYPGSLNWGFHFLGFVPPYFLAAYFALSVAIFILLKSGHIGRAATAAAGNMERKPLRFLVYSVAVFIIFALVFRVKASLLGDSFTLIKNMRDYASGISYLAPWHEPLSIYFLYYALTLIGSLDYSSIFTSFFVIEICLGAGFIVTTYWIVRNLFQQPLHRFFSYALLLVLPYMEFYFGYIEVYSVSTLLLALFILLSLLVLNGKTSFNLLPAVWLLLTLSHYVNGILGLSVLYLAFLEYKKTGRVPYAGFGIAAGLLAAVLAGVGFDLDRLINQSPVSHFLSISGSISIFNAYSQAYTIFSFYHMLDLANYFVLMSPFALVLVALWFVRKKRGGRLSSSLNIWFLAACLPLLLYMFVAKLEQGTASDWDVFAAHFYLFNIFAAFVFFRETGEDTSKTFSLILCVSLLNSLVWFHVNSLREPSIIRFQSLWDKRILSHLGNYTHALRLTRYYDSQNDSLSQIDVWEKYSNLYPDDPRGYMNTIQALSEFAPGDFQRKTNTYQRWISTDPGNDSLKTAYASFCVNAGNKYFEGGHLEKAKIYYLLAIGGDSASSRALNNLGSVFAEQGSKDTAIFLFNRALQIYPEYPEANFNIGRAYFDGGDKPRGIQFIRKAARLGNVQAQQFLSNRGDRW